MKLAVAKHFETSKVAGGLKIPHEIAAAAFGGDFRIERGQLVAYTGDIPMYSHSRHGEVADFDEALGQLIDRYPNKDMIQRKDGEPGAAPGQQDKSTATITRTQFDSLPPASRAKFFGDGGRIGDVASAGAPAPAPAKPAGGNAITRPQFDVMGPRDRAMHFKNGGSIVD